MKAERQCYHEVHNQSLFPVIWVKRQTALAPTAQIQPTWSSIHETYSASYSQWPTWSFFCLSQPMWPSSLQSMHPWKTASLSRDFQYSLRQNRCILLETSRLYFWKSTWELYFWICTHISRCIYHRPPLSCWPSLCWSCKQLPLFMPHLSTDAQEAFNTKIRF